MRKPNPTALNISANLMSFIVTFAISFFTTPYITQRVGMEAYGLIGLANNFTSYITIITAALNSMASRFIILEYHKNNTKEANSYLNSALFANAACAILTMLGSIFVVFNLDHIINVSPALVTDAQITFALIFINFSLSLVFSIFSIGYYATNKLYVGAWRTVLSDMIRALLLYIIFTQIGVKIQYTVIATIIATLFSNILAVRFAVKNIPTISFSFRYCKFKYFLKMVSAGVWNSISKLSNVLLNGLDLIITNLFIGGPILGCVSVAKTFSNIIITMIGSVSDVFLPKFLKAYAEDKQSLNEEFFKSTKILGYFSCMFLSLFISFSESFYNIWLPGEDAVLLRNLSCISLLSIAISGPVYSMFSMYTVVNKVRPQALSSLVMSVLSTISVFLLLKFTNLGVYAIVGTSAIYGALKNLTYNMYCLNKYTKLNVKKCYLIILKNLITMICTVLANIMIIKNISILNFPTLGIAILITALIDSLIYFIMALGYNDKVRTIKLISAKIKSIFSRNNRKES